VQPTPTARTLPVGPRGIHHVDASPREGVPLQVVDSPVAARQTVTGHLSVEANASTGNQVQVDQSVHGDGTSSSPEPFRSGRQIGSFLWPTASFTPLTST